MDEQIPFFQSIEMNPPIHDSKVAGGSFSAWYREARRPARIAARSPNATCPTSTRSSCEAAPADEPLVGSADINRWPTWATASRW